MAVVGELLVLIGANNSALTAGLARSEAQLKGFSSSATTSMAGVRMAALGVGVAAVAGLGASINAAGDFQESMGIINTIAHQTPAELKKTGDALIDMATKSGTPLKDLTDAYYELLSAGIKPGAEALNVLGLSNTLAIGGLATTKQTVDLLTTAMNAYSLDSKGAAVATDQFALAIQDGKVTADQIAATFSDVAPLAKTMGIGIDEVAATYAVLTSRGVPASEAMVQMNRAMVEVIKPNKELIGLQNKMGVNFADIAKDKGLVVALEEMRKGAEANGVPFTDLFGRLEGLKFALATTGPEFATYQTELGKMGSAGGTAAEQAAERMGTFNRSLMIVGESVNAAFISIGTSLLPAVTGIANAVSGAVASFTSWSDANPGLAANILLVVGAVAGLIVVALGVGVILGAIGTVIGIITSPILLIGAAILGLAAYFGLLGDGAKGAVDGVLAMLGNLASQAVTFLSGLGSRIMQWITTQGPAFLAGLLRWADSFMAWIAPMIPKVLGALGQLGTSMIQWVLAEGPKIAVAIGKLALQFVSWIAPKIPVLLGQLALLGLAILGWIGQQVPVIALKMLGWAGEIIGWINRSIPGMVAAFNTWMASLQTMLSTAGAQLAAAALKMGQDLVANLMAGIGDIGKRVGDELNKIPGVSLVGSIAGEAADIAGTVAGAVPHFQTGGVIPGSGPQLIMGHGGETVMTPGQLAAYGGRGGGQSQINLHVALQIGERTIAEIIETVLYNAASGSSSGFAGSPVTS